MRTAVIVHGAPGKEECFDPNIPSPSNHHWIPWLQKQLIINGYSAQTPEIPDPWDPQYPTWKREFERYDISEDSPLIGHSCGGGFLVRWLSEHPDVRVGRVVLVAPWVDPSRDRTSEFFNFKVDTSLAERTNGLVIFNSDNDGEGIQKSVSMLRESIKNAHYREFHNYGHFCIDTMGGVAFPELLDTVLIRF